MKMKESGLGTEGLPLRSSLEQPHPERFSGIKALGWAWREFPRKSSGDWAESIGLIVGTGMPDSS